MKLVIVKYPKIILGYRVDKFPLCWIGVVMLLRYSVFGVNLSRLVSLRVGEK